MSHPISTWNESPLHAALKEWVAYPGDQFEAAVDGYIVDILRGDHLIEIQTGNFASIRDKLIALVEHHPVRLVYPVAEQKWIVKLPKDGEADIGSLPRRKSPKRGTFEEVFRELVSFPQLVTHHNFTLDVLLIHEEELRRYDGREGRGLECRHRERRRLLRRREEGGTHLEGLRDVAELHEHFGAPVAVGHGGRVRHGRSRGADHGPPDLRPGGGETVRGSHPHREGARQPGTGICRLAVRRQVHRDRGGLGELRASVAACRRQYDGHHCQPTRPVLHRHSLQGGRRIVRVDTCNHRHQLNIRGNVAF